MIQLVQSNAEKVDEMHKIKLLTDDIIRQMYNQTRTVKVRTALCLVLVRPNRQTSDSIFYKIPERILTADSILTADRIETERIRTDRHQTENPDRIWTADRHWTRFSEKLDKNETRTGHGQCCPPTSDEESFRIFETFCILIKTQLGGK